MFFWKLLGVITNLTHLQKAKLNFLSQYFVPKMSRLTNSYLVIEYMMVEMGKTKQNIMENKLEALKFWCLKCHVNTGYFTLLNIQIPHEDKQ